MTRSISVAGRQVPLPLLLCASALGAALFWSYWPALVQMAHRWSVDPQYSHGYLVPVFSVVLLWLRSEHLTKVSFQPNWWGLPLLLVGGLMSLPGAYLYIDAIDALSLLPCIAGCFLLLGGWAALRWAWPAVAFLAFMLPLPYSVERGLAGPLQRLATILSTYALQTLGLPAVAEGNIIQLTHRSVEVAQACSGLSMLMIFFALSTAVVLLIRKPLLDKLIILVSAIPIAVASNVIRITVTAVLYEKVNSAWIEKLFHDGAGWMMMIWGLAFLWLELWILSRLFLALEEARPVTLSFPNAAARSYGRKAEAKATTT